MYSMVCVTQLTPPLPIYLLSVGCSQQGSLGQSLDRPPVGPPIRLPLPRSSRLAPLARLGRGLRVLAARRRATSQDRRLRRGSGPSRLAAAFQPRQASAPRPAPSRRLATPL